MLQTVSAQALPAWSEADRARLKKGELIAGADILVEAPDAVPLPRVAPEPEVPPVEPAEPEPEYDPKVIPQEYLADYFLSNPESYLIDPQRLLSMQESLDREGFLEYHADDSDVDIRMYLFDAQQEIPAPYTIEKLVSERYAGGPLTAVVFFFLGDPSRNQLAFGGEGASGVPTEDVRKMLDNAQMKAMEKSDPAAQVESFIVQLSIRLYWLEKEQAESRAVAAGSGSAGEGASTMAGPTKGSAGSEGRPLGNEPGSAGSVLASVKPFWLYLLVGVLGVSSLCVALFLVWRMWMTNKTYHFPVMEIPRRLEANYAAGVGAVMAFHNKLGSPSSQRDQVPDYLTRM
ncbi:MAG: hypothetical protein H7A51_06025 [Akkermansiaceae bacterium]|nr:hypothetical protein [Akkermansiaceae bacterium]